MLFFIKSKQFNMKKYIFLIATLLIFVFLFYSCKDNLNLKPSNGDANIGDGVRHEYRWCEDVYDAWDSRKKPDNQIEERSSAPDHIDKAMAGAETPDQGLLVVGFSEHVNERKAFITRYLPRCRRAETIFPAGWEEIYDIKETEPGFYVIVGKQASQQGPGVAIISDEGPDDVASFINVFHPNTIGFPESYGRAINFTTDNGYIIACQSSDTNPGVSCGAVPNGLNQNINSTYLVKLNQDLTYAGRSQCLGSMNLAHGVAECDGFYLTSGQHASGQGISIASIIPEEFDENDVQTQIYAGIQSSDIFSEDNGGVKAKMLICTAGKAYVSGRIDDEFALVEFPYPDDVETGAFASIYTELLTNDDNGYGQCLVQADGGGWAVAGQVDQNNGNDEDMAILRISQNYDAAFGGYPMIGSVVDLTGETEENDDADFANYVIQMSNGDFALFGQADHQGGSGNTYVAIISGYLPE